MAHIEESIDIQRPCDEVFAYVATLDCWREWAHLVVELSRSSPGPLQEGATFTVVNRFLGRTLETTYRVTEYEPPRRLAARSVTGPVAGGFTFTCDEVPGGTRFIEAWDFEPGSVFKLAAPLVAGAARRQTAKNIASLKECLEARI